MSSSKRGSLSGFYVLVAEDDHDAREIFRLVLEYFGAMVMMSTTAEEAAKTLRVANPDIVIADVRLGDHDALWLLRQVRRAKCDAPFVAVSAEDFNQEELQAQGFAAYLRKPVDHEQLFQTIVRVARRGT